MLTSSPYASAAARYRDQGWHVIPCGPGTKVPHEWVSGQWRPLPGWQKYCDTMPAEFLHDQWERWPDAGICLAHGNVIGLDLDTERRDVEEALHRAVPASPAKRRGSKGWMGYYRPGHGLDGVAARVRWYDQKVMGADGQPSRIPVVELLLHGTQSVLPPTIHPGTGKPYAWVTAETLETLEASDLPEFGGIELAALDRELAALGLTRQTPRKVDMAEYDRPAPGAHDLEKPHGRSVNDRAMEPAAVDAWWPALNLPKSRQRGPGRWEAVAAWRGSGSGRPMQDRNPNLKITPQGIVDFGADRSYTPIDVVMAALDCSYGAAVEFLTPHIRPEDGGGIGGMDAIRENVFEAAPEIIPAEPVGMALWEAINKPRETRRIEGIKPSSPTEFASAFPKKVPPFPVQDYRNDLTGLLRLITIHLDLAANMRSEQGAFGAALAMLGTLFGKRVEVFETGLRTNLYVVGTAASGAGKSSAMNAMHKTCEDAGISDLLAGSDFTSGAAILQEISANRPCLFSIDEFGDVMRRALNPKAAAHERDIARILKDMYSAAAGTYKGKSYASRDRIDLIQPHLCIYGVSTYEAFWEGIDGRSYSDGLLARFLAIPIGETEPQTPDLRYIDDVKRGITKACGVGRPSTGNLADVALVAVPMKLAPGIFDKWMADRALFQRFSKYASDQKIPGAPSIINRICENGMKIAMISAAGRLTDDMELTRSDYDLGISVAHWSAISMMEAIGRYYVENSSHRDLNRVVEFIEASGSTGRTKTELVDKMRGIFVNSSVSKGIMQTITDSGDVIEWRDTTSSTKPKTWYVARKHAKAFFTERGME